MDTRNPWGWIGLAAAWPGFNKSSDLCLFGGVTGGVIGHFPKVDAVAG